jgi:hypothetical protein
MEFALGVAAASLRWKLQKAFWSMKAERNTLAKERVLLRELLRGSPQWTQGHLQLGFTELALELSAENRRDPRALARVRVSAAAAEVLTENETGSRTERVRLQAEYLRSMVLFLSRDFEGALRGLMEVLKPESAALLSESLGLQAMEYAAAAEMALGQKQNALRWFSAIPEGRRSAEVIAAIEYLNR